MVQKDSSGGDINERSSNISEGQRMESAADYGDVVNNSVTNNSKQIKHKVHRPNPFQML